MSRVRTDFRAGKAFVALAAEAIADGLTAAAIQAQGISTQGMFQAPNRVTRKVSKGGVEYYPGAGSPRGGYPGVRTGTLERSLGTERARVNKGGRVVGFLTDSAPYAYYVHGSKARPLRPFLTLPFSRNRSDIMRAFVKGTRRRLG